MNAFKRSIELQVVYFSIERWGTFGVVYTAKEMNSIVESVDHSEKHVGVTTLVPMDVAVGTLIETVIKKCNELGDFVFENYYVTNQNIPDTLEINNIIEIVKE